MNAVAAYLAALDAGVVLVRDGPRLRLSSANPPPADLVQRLKAHKPEILLMIGTWRACARWDAADWRALMVERSAIAEHDGGLDRADADAIALAECRALGMRAEVDQ